MRNRVKGSVVAKDNTEGIIKNAELTAWAKGKMECMMTKEMRRNTTNTCAWGERKQPPACLAYP